LGTETDTRRNGSPPALKSHGVIFVFAGWQKVLARKSPWKTFFLFFFAFDLSYDLGNQTNE
jgi:hypothetical protein